MSKSVFYKAIENISPKLIVITKTRTSKTTKYAFKSYTFLCVFHYANNSNQGPDL